MKTGATLLQQAVKRTRCEAKIKSLLEKLVSGSCLASLLALVMIVSGVVGLCGGCNAMRNGWLDPTAVGNYRDDVTLQIRESLTGMDAVRGIPGASEPTPEDLVPSTLAYPISPGDVLAVEIAELTVQFAPWQSQLQVDEVGQINIPKIGRVTAAGLTTRELEEEIKRLLGESEHDLLKDPEVIVQGMSLHEATYSVFGIGVSASTNAPLRAGTFPIRRPDLRVLEAINQVGGLNEFVTDIYVFRQGPTQRKTPATRPADDDGPSSMPSESSPADADEANETEDNAALPTESVPDEPQGVAPEEEIRQLVLEQKPPAHVTISGEQDRAGAEPSPKYEWIDGQFELREGLGEREDADGGAVAQLPSFEAMQSTIDWGWIAGERDYRIIRVPADALRAGSRDYNIVVRGKDVIRIVSGEIGVYYVMGQVARPGSFAFNAEQITLKSAIAAAGNLAALAWPSNCTVYRRNGRQEQMIQVDLDAIFAGKTPDFEIRRGDVINVGTSPVAPFLARLRAFTLPNPATNIGYSFTYSRNFADIDSFSSQINPANKPSRFPNLFP